MCIDTYFIGDFIYFILFINRFIHLLVIMNQINK